MVCEEVLRNTSSLFFGVFLCFWVVVIALKNAFMGRGFLEGDFGFVVGMFVLTCLAGYWEVVGVLGDRNLLRLP